MALSTSLINDLGGEELVIDVAVCLISNLIYHLDSPTSTNWIDV